MGVPAGAPKLIVVSGYPAAGKSTLSRRLATDLQLPLVRKDALKPVLVELAGSWPPPDGSERWGRATRRVVETTVADILVSSPVVVDSNFNWSHDHEGLVALVAELGAETFEVCLWGDPAVLKKRWEQREGHTRAVLDEALDRPRLAVTHGSGPVHHIDTTAFDELEAAYPKLLNDIRWFTNQLPKKRVAAGMLLRDGAGRVVLVHQNYGELVWNLPGGLVEPGESPADGAQREVGEELGLDIAPGPILDVDHTPADSLIFVYDGGLLTDAAISAIRLQEAELDDLALVKPAELDAYLTGVRLARVSRALAALG